MSEELADSVKITNVKGIEDLEPGSIFADDHGWAYMVTSDGEGGKSIMSTGIEDEYSAIEIGLPVTVLRYGDQK